MPSTPAYALPYPAETDTADVPRDIQALAARLDAILPGVGVPTGGGIDWYAASAPAGFLLCDGSAVSRTTYPALFAAIGTTWGIGDGSTTFNLPDCRARVVVGVNPGGANHAAIAGNDGTPIASRRIQHGHTIAGLTATPALTAAHSLTLPPHGHGVNETPHGHGVNDPPHAHLMPFDVYNWRSGGYHDGDSPGGLGWQGGQSVAAVSTGVTVRTATTGLTVGNPTSLPAIPGAVTLSGGVTVGGTVGVAGTVDGPSYVVVAKVIKT